VKLRLRDVVLKHRDSFTLPVMKLTNSVQSTEKNHYVCRLIRQTVGTVPTFVMLQPLILQKSVIQ
jgi:hypothetical protein